MQLARRLTASVLAFVGLAAVTHGRAEVTDRVHDTRPSAIAPAQASAQARALIEQMLAAQRALKSYSATLEVVETGPQVRREHTKVIAFERPHRALVVSKSAEGDTRVLADGRNLYIVAPHDQKRYQKQPLGSRPGGVVLALSRSVDKFTRGLLLGADVRSFTFTPISIGPSDKVAGVPVQTVIATLRSDDQEMTMTFAIGERDHLLRRHTLSLVVNGQHAKASATFTNVKASPALPDEMFVFTPPPGARALSPAATARQAPGSPR